MSTSKQQEHSSNQLQLFGSEVPAEVVVTPTAFVEPQPAARSGLRLVSSTSTAQQSKVEDLTAIEARLIGRAKFF
jgi:hypothetical protein